MSHKPSFSRSPWIDLSLVAHNEHSSLIASRGGVLENKRFAGSWPSGRLAAFISLTTSLLLKATWVTFVRIKPSGLDLGFPGFFETLFNRHWQVYFLFVKILHLYRSGLFDFLLWKHFKLTSSTYRSSHSGSTVGISGTGPAHSASTVFSSPLSSSSLFKHLSTALTSCGGYFAACWAMPPIKWMWRCHGAPPVLFVQSVSKSSANPGWFVIHPVSLRTKPVPCRPRRSAAIMPHWHI